MSKGAVESFYRTVIKDPALQEQFKAVADEDAFVRLAVDLGSRRGFDFSAEEVRDRLNQVSGGSTSDVSDRELEKVVGGVGTPASSIIAGYVQK